MKQLLMILTLLLASNAFSQGEKCEHSDPLCTDPFDPSNTVDGIYPPGSNTPPPGALPSLQLNVVCISDGFKIITDTYPLSSSFLIITDSENNLLYSKEGGIFNGSQIFFSNTLPINHNYGQILNIYATVEYALPNNQKSIATIEYSCIR